MILSTNINLLVLNSFQKLEEIISKESESILKGNKAELVL